MVALRCGTLWCLLILLTISQNCNAQKKSDPACPIDMNAYLPAASFSGPVKCSSGNTAKEAGGRCEDLSGKVALVTGASTGLGRGIADRLAAAGMKVIGTSRNPEQYQGNCVYNKPGDRCKPAGWQLWQMDQTSQSSVDQLMQRIKDTYGRIDLLVLNAGRGYGSNTFIPNGKVMCNDIDQMQVVMDTNFFGPVRVLKAALPLIQKQGYARIFNVVSTAAWVNIQGGLPYAASKAANNVITEEWLYEFYGNKAGNIKFINIHPGSMLSDLARKSVPGCKAQSANFDGKVLKESDWKQWEGFQYGPQQANNYILPTQGGEAIYRLAINPAPKKRYLLNVDRGVNFMHKRICTHLSAPIEAWPKAYD